MNPMQTYWAMFAILIGIAYVIAFTRRGSATMAMPSRTRTCSHPAAPAEVFAAIQSIARPFRVEATDASANIVVLSSPVSFGSWGFFYPVIITANASGGSDLLVGCKSKVFRVGPLVTRAHERCVVAILESLNGARARVVQR